jgi:glycosyltransferase involved in cell wall biosynthesis
MGLATLDATVVRQQDWQDREVFAKFCTDNKVDVLHTHWSTDAFVPPFAARFSGVPVRMMTRHSPYPFKTSLGRLLYTRFLYNRILAISQSVANTLITCGVPEDKITVVHHGTNVVEFENVSKTRAESRAEIGLGDDIVAVGILGRIAEEKGHRYLYDALKMLPHLANLRIVVVGEGPLLDEQQAYVKQNALEDRVIWVPFRSDVNNVINALDIVAVPSTWEEPCSAVIQQGMALSKPVIGTRVGGTPEMIVEGVTGMLADARNASQLAQAMETLASHADVRDRQGAAGAMRVRELFTLEHMTARIEEIYYQELRALGESVRGETAARRTPGAAQCDARRL